MAYRPEWINEGLVVWTDETRKRYDRRSQRYPSDCTNEEWAILEPMLPVAQGKGRPREHTLREIINGIRYVVRYGIPWDAMPKDLPPSVSAMTTGGGWAMVGIWIRSPICWSWPTVRRTDGKPVQPWSLSMPNPSNVTLRKGSAAMM